MKTAVSEHLRRQANCALLGQICKRYQAQTNRMLQDVQLYRGQELILAQLWQQDALTPSELAERLLVQPATITNALQAMERSGMVERRRASHDQRVVQVFLTEAGRASQAPVEAIWRTVEQCAFSEFSPAEEEALHRLLSKLNENLIRLADQGV
jgi:MarR family transcriptional regulator, organic hydroperoxide resistance regulator